MTGTPEAPGGAMIPLPQVLAFALAKQEWDRIIGYLTQMGIARPLYATPISLYCMLVGKSLEQWDELGKESIVLSGKQGPKTNPKFEILVKLVTKTLSLATECGLTPASTRRLHAPDAPLDDEARQEKEFFGENEE